MIIHASRYLIQLSNVVRLTAVLAVLPLVAGAAGADKSEASKKLEGLDSYVEKVLKDWNGVGIGIGVVVDDELVFAKGYGYRDYEKKLPFTAKTLCPIASNTKLFTAVSAGMLVEEGKLNWDKPVHHSVPALEFQTDFLNNTITLRDMLSHRTGITRHDLIWYKSDFTRKDLFERLRYMEPQEAPRQVFLYNNMMFCAVGFLIELQSGKTWESFVREHLFEPLEMSHACFTIADMRKQPEFGVPYAEKRDSYEIYKIPYYEDTLGMAPAGAIISNIDELSHWLIALMNEGKYQGKQAVPASILKKTLEPAIPLPNVLGETKGYWEILNGAYCMGRETFAYRGHLLTKHGGALDGFYSQVSFMPQERIGVLAFVIGEHCGALPDPISYNVYERLLGLSLTPWSDRWLEVRLKNKKAGTEARAKAGAQRVPDTRPSHPLKEYAGDYVHPAYGTLHVGLKSDQLQFDFHKLQFPMSHFHYDRFDTPDDERYGKWSVNFMTNPQGDVDRATMSLDEAEVIFTRRPEAPSREVLQQLVGTYQSPGGFNLRVVLKKDGTLARVFPGEPEEKLLPYKGLKFHLEHFSDQTVEFVMENDEVKRFKQIDPSGEYLFPKQSEP
jgi:CubicO group peptidase (beta-lactamase class C family)